MLKNAEDRREEGLACNILYMAYIVSMLDHHLYPQRQALQGKSS